MVETTLHPLAFSDGTSNVLTICMPAAATANAPVVFVYPAMGVPARYYTPLLEAFAEQGVIAACADLRGLGNSSVRASRSNDFSYRHHVESDLPEILAELRTQLPDRKLFLFGHSLGGQMEALHLSANHDAADGLILTASCSVYYKGWDFQQRYILLAVTQFYRAAAATMGYFPGKKLGFGGTEAKGVMQDWGRQALRGRYDLADTELDYEALLATQPKPVLAISFTTDTFAPKNAVQNLVDKFTAAKTEHWNIDGNDVGVPKANHMNWVKSPQQLTEKIVSWIAKQ